MRIFLSILFAVVLLTLPVSSASSSPEYQRALPGYTYQFPRDHASHPSFKTEWWYYTGHLKADASHEQFGYELTFFRTGAASALAPQASLTKWLVPDIYFAHLALTDVNGQRFYFTEQLARPKDYLAGASTDTLDVHLKDWRAYADAQGRHHLRARSPELTLNLNLSSAKPPTIHGHDGVSQKADCLGCASHYYSLTRLQTQGQLQWQGRTLAVSGTSWMDHEFGSNQLTTKQTGWDWFSIQLDSNEELMLYFLRLKDGGFDSNSSGTWVDSLGDSQHLVLRDTQVTILDYWISPHTKGRYPMKWRVKIPSRQADLIVTAKVRDQELVLADKTGFSYWEGACAVSGTVAKQPVKGQAYVEMTGYDHPFEQAL